MDTHRVDGMCAHTSRRLTIEGCGSSSCVQSVMKKIGENNQKVGKIGQVMN